LALSIFKVSVKSGTSAILRFGGLGELIENNAEMYVGVANGEKVEFVHFPEF
jgi:hypothetical protein